MRATAKKPEDRYQSAAGFAAALRGWLAKSKTQPPAPAPPAATAPEVKEEILTAEICEPAPAPSGAADPVLRPKRAKSKPQAVAPSQQPTTQPPASASGAKGGPRWGVVVLALVSVPVIIGAGVGGWFGASAVADSRHHKEQEQLEGKLNREKEGEVKHLADEKARQEEQALKDRLEVAKDRLDRANKFTFEMVGFDDYLDTQKVALYPAQSKAIKKALAGPKAEEVAEVEKGVTAFEYATYAFLQDRSHRSGADPKAEVRRARALTRLDAARERLVSAAGWVGREQADFDAFVKTYKPKPKEWQRLLKEIKDAEASARPEDVDDVEKGVREYEKAVIAFLKRPRESKYQDKDPIKAVLVARIKAAERRLTNAHEWIRGEKGFDYAKAHSSKPRNFKDLSEEVRKAAGDRSKEVQAEAVEDAVQKFEDEVIAFLKKPRGGGEAKGLPEEVAELIVKPIKNLEIAASSRPERKDALTGLTRKLNDSLQSAKYRVALRVAADIADLAVACRTMPATKIRPAFEKLLRSQRASWEALGELETLKTFCAVWGFDLLKDK
jgi:hypothetical protein